MRRNPFVTVVLLIITEILLYKYIDYANLISPSSKYAELIMPFFLFSIPMISILISVLIKDMSYKKEFRYFSIFLLITPFLVFVVLSYLGALANAYQH